MEMLPRRNRLDLWTSEARDAIGTIRTAGELLGPPRGAGVAGLQLIDVETYLPDDLLFKADIASMANSLELRAPLLDHHLAELALSMPDRLKFRGSTGKIALRQAFAADLPSEILGRGKAGFGVPVSQWFRAELRSMAAEVLLDPSTERRGQFDSGAVESVLTAHASGRADHGEAIWGS